MRLRFRSERLNPAVRSGPVPFPAERPPAAQGGKKGGFAVGEGWVVCIACLRCPLPACPARAVAILAQTQSALAACYRPGERLSSHAPRCASLLMPPPPRSPGRWGGQPRASPKGSWLAWPPGGSSGGIGSDEVAQHPRGTLHALLRGSAGVRLGFAGRGPRLDPGDGERIGEAKKPGPRPEPGPAVCQTVNLTSWNKNIRRVLRWTKADILVVQEHRLKTDACRGGRTTARELGWKAILQPAAGSRRQT